MKNLKKIALSLLVVGLAVGFSAFKSSVFTPAKTEKILSINDDFLVQRDANQFTQVNPLDPNEAPLGTCETPASRKCIYIVTEAGKANIPSLSALMQTYYTTAQIDSYLAHSPAWLVADPLAEDALYAD